MCSRWMNRIVTSLVAVCMAFAGQAATAVWTGLAGNGLLSDPQNWAGEIVPSADDTLDFSAVSSATAITADFADGRIFQTVTFGAGVLTMHGDFRVNTLVNASKLAVASTGTLTVTGDLVGYAARNTKPLLYSNEGTVTVGGLVRFRSSGTSKGESVVMQYEVSGENSKPIVASGLAYHADSWSDYLVANLGSVNNGPGKWVVGADGFSFPSSRLISHSGFRVKNQVVTLYSSADWTLAESYRHQGNDLYIRGTGSMTIDTTDYNDHTTGRTVTLKGYINAQNSLGTQLTVTGCGTVVLDSVTANNHTNVVSGIVAVENGATLQINKDVVVGGTGSISLASGATLALPANADGTFTTREVSVSLPETGVANLVIDGSTPLQSGDYLLFTSMPSGFTGANLAVSGTAVSGRDSGVVDVDGQLYLRVPQDDTLNNTTPLLVFPGATLADLATHTLRARMHGGAIDDKGVEATFFDRRETREDGALIKVSYQLQITDKSHIKAARVEFTEGDGGVYAKLADGNYSNYNGTFSYFGVEPLNTNPRTASYLPYDFALVEAVINSINVNFTHEGAGIDTSSSVRFGAGDYAVPYSEWANMPAENNGATNVNGATVMITGTRGSYVCPHLNAAKDVRHGYIDDSADNPTPTIAIGNIPYRYFRVVVYAATDVADAQFGYVEINGKDYTGTVGATLAGADAWGAAGALKKAKGLREGVNYLVSPVLSGPTVTVVGHRGADSTVRGCIAAVQVVEFVPKTYSATIDGEGSYVLSALAWDQPLPNVLTRDAGLSVNAAEDASVMVDVPVDVSIIDLCASSGKSLSVRGSGVSALDANVNGRVVLEETTLATLAMHGGGTLVCGRGAVFVADDVSDFSGMLSAEGGTAAWRVAVRGSAAADTSTGEVRIAAGTVATVLGDDEIPDSGGMAVCEALKVANGAKLVVGGIGMIQGGRLSLAPGAQVAFRFVDGAASPKLKLSAPISIDSTVEE